MSLVKTLIAFTIAILPSLYLWHTYHYAWGVFMFLVFGVFLGIPQMGTKGERLRRGILFVGAMVLFTFVTALYSIHDMSYFRSALPEYQITDENRVAEDAIFIDRRLKKGNRIRYAMVPFVQEDGGYVWVEMDAVIDPVPAEGEVFMPFPPGRNKAVEKELDRRDRSASVVAYGDIVADSFSERLEREVFVLVAMYVIVSVLFFLDHILYSRKKNTV